MANRTLRSIAMVLALTAPANVEAATQIIELRAGWNLISLALQPDDPAIDVVLRDLITAGMLRRVWTYDAATDTWSVYPAPVEGTPSIAALEPGAGYWVEVTSASTLTVQGDPTQASVELNLVAGWNLIGFPTDQPKRYDRVFIGTSVREIWKYDASAGVFRGIDLPLTGPPSREDFTEIEPGVGYWVKTDVPGALAPALATALPGDIDVEPLLAPPGVHDRVLWMEFSPGDVDIGEDGYYDRPSTQRALNFGEDLASQVFSIANQTSGILSWTASIDNPTANPWIRFRLASASGIDEQFVSELAGAVATESAQLELAVDRTGLPIGEYDTTIHIRSNGAADAEPDRDIQVHMNVAPIDGDYEVLAKIETVNGQRADLHNPRLFLSVFSDRDGLKGIVDDERTLLLPRRLRLVGEFYEAETNRFTLAGAFELPAGDQLNPYDTALQREIILTGDRSERGDPRLGPLDLKGRYQETLDQILDESIVLEGTFTARRLDSRPSTLDGSSDLNPTGGIITSSDIITQTIDVTDRVLITDVQVNVNINHTRPSDLTVSLASPNGTVVILRDRSPGPVANLTYGLDAESLEPLDLFYGELSEGTWTLQIQDHETDEDGELIFWRLQIGGTEVHELGGTISESTTLLPIENATVVLTGCGLAQLQSTAADGTYRFHDWIDCIYDVSVLRSGYLRLSREVVLSGSDSLDNDFVLDPAGSGLPIPFDPPADEEYRFAFITTIGSAGTPGQESAFDSATFDIDRPPLDPENPGPEDTNAFQDELDPLTQSNEVGVNGRIDGPVGSNSFHIYVHIGNLIVGRSVEGNRVLKIGTNP